jgi:two-component system, NarL family, nitrate/nitrite response regulator NarL
MSAGVVIIDPSPLWRSGLEALVAEHGALRLVASLDGPKAIKKLPPASAVDVIVLHLGPANLDEWLRAAREVRSAPAKTRVIALHRSLTIDQQAALEATGEISLVDEQSAEAALVRALLDPMHRTRRRWEAPTLGPVPLSDRESEILRRVAAGMTSAEVAVELRLGLRTVENAKKALFSRLGVMNQAHAVSLAVQFGLLNDLIADRSGSPTVLDALAGRLVTDPMAVAVGRSGVGAVPVGVLVTLQPLAGDQVLEAIRAGTHAIVHETQTIAQLQYAVDQAALGRSTLADGDLQMLVAALRSPIAQGPAPTLTPREQDLLRSVAAGESVKQTARSLGIAVKTVENTQRMLFRKLGVRNRSQAVAVAADRGLLNPGAS